MKSMGTKKFGPMILPVIAAIIFSLVLSSCGNSSQGGPTNTPSETTPTQTAEDTNTESALAEPVETAQAGPAERSDYELPLVSEPFTIHIWAPTSAQIQKTMTNLKESYYYKELESRTGVSVEFTHPSLGQELEAFNLLISSGDFPDILELQPGLTYPGGLDKGISDGVILRLNELIDQYAPNYKYFLDTMDVVAKEASTNEGNYAAFYSISVDGPQPPWMGMVVRKDWLDDLGLDTPATFDDWHEMLTAFKEQKGAVAPMMLQNYGYVPLDIFHGGYGFANSGQYFQIDNVIHYAPLEDGHKEYVEMMAQWFSEGLIDPDFASKSDFTPAKDYTTTGKTGAFWEMYHVISSNYDLATEDGYELIAVPTPSKTEGEQLHVRQTNTTTGMVSWALTSAASDPEKIVKWIDYGYSPEGDILAAYGVEGVSFEYGDNGKPAFNELIYQNPDGLNLAEAYNYYAKHGGAVAYHWDREYAGQPAVNLNAQPIWMQNNDGAWMLPPITLSTQEGEEHALIYSDIQTYVQEMVVKFITGQEPMANYDQFVDQIRSMGIERCIEIQQSALDRFNSK
ncbi:MAG: extracellular solute-binding protein [Clostridiales bacterium]|jgi:putative aldouronate transport system substrate-binding protein|nr:extracellular solute-binding protein [Clostridiales bacterium]